MKKKSYWISMPANAQLNGNYSVIPIIILSVP